MNHKLLNFYKTYMAVNAVVYPKNATVIDTKRILSIRDDSLNYAAMEAFYNQYIKPIHEGKTYLEIIDELNRKFG